MCVRAWVCVWVKCIRLQYLISWPILVASYCFSPFIIADFTNRGKSMHIDRFLSFSAGEPSAWEINLRHCQSERANQTLPELRVNYRTCLVLVTDSVIPWDHWLLQEFFLGWPMGGRLKSGRTQRASPSHTSQVVTEWTGGHRGASMKSRGRGLPYLTPGTAVTAWDCSAFNGHLAL